MVRTKRIVTRRRRNVGSRALNGLLPPAIRLAQTLSRGRVEQGRRSVQDDRGRMMGVRHTPKELERERERMRAVYAAMTDAKFEEVANDADSLTEVARATLRAGMLRRGMEAPTETNSEMGEAEPPAPKPAIVGRYRDRHLATVRNSRLDAAGIEEFLAGGTMSGGMG